MKIIKQILFGTIAIIFAVACEEGIDPITPVEPGPDESAPQITMNYPVEGTQIQLPEQVSSINIQFEVTDDIEINTIDVSYDGSQIASYSDFKDYRRAVIDSLIYDNVTNGTHTVSVTATDTDGKTTTKEVEFEKSPPYVPKYEGELLYMPFDGDYMDMISFETATVVGNPGFSDESVLGPQSYKGAPDSYLTFPGERFQQPEITAVMWMKVNGDPDRAGILVMSPDNPDFDTSRQFGFRFFREAGGGLQQFKLNAGNGTAETWFDGGEAARVDPATDTWHHFAFTISGTEAVVYIDGQVVSQKPFDGVDWTGCDLLSIMSGDPRFAEWNHHSDLSLMDELRIFDHVLTQEEIQGIITEESGKNFTYTPKYDGEIFYMPFDDDYLEYVSQMEADVHGSPGFTDGKVGKAYAGNIDSYLTFPAEDLHPNQFSAAFWFNIQLTDPEPEYGHRAGILVMGPEDTENENYPESQNLRTNGFRFFREGGEANQIFKLNGGSGDGETWFDGGDAATLDPAATEWVHLAFTISDTEAVVYINGEVVKQGDFAGIDWTGCDILSIMSGAPRFTGWNHLSDESYMDELRLFNKALTQEEVQTIMADEM